MTDPAAALRGQALVAEFRRQARTRRWLRPALLSWKLVMLAAVAYFWWRRQYAWGFWPGLGILAAAFFEAEWARRDWKRIAAAAAHLQAPDE